jgi:hypothetical protein
MTNSNSYLVSSQELEPVEYLVIGHITKDIVPGGYSIGGTASYASLTAHALGKQVGIVTSCASDVSFSIFNKIQIVNFPSKRSTTFENIPLENGRIQTIHHRANQISKEQIPPIWCDTPIVHIGPVAFEIDPDIIDCFPHSFIGITPQGFLRKWNKSSLVQPGSWKEAGNILPLVSAAVLSMEDVQANEKIIENFISLLRVLVITEGSKGSSLYWNGDMRSFPPPKTTEVDPTGAGDIFAAAFFIRFQKTRDPWESARFATILAAHSVNRKGLDGIPNPLEIQNAEAEIVLDVQRL